MNKVTDNGKVSSICFFLVKNSNEYFLSKTMRNGKEVLEDVKDRRDGKSATTRKKMKTNSKNYNLKHLVFCY